MKNKIFFLILSLFSFALFINSAKAVIPTFQSAGTGSGVAGDPSPAYPTGLQANDLILLQVTVRSTTATVTTPTGFTLLYGPDTGGTGRQWIFYKFATGSESGTITVDQSGTTCAAARMYSFRNVDTSNFNEDGGFGYGSSTTILAQSVTTTGADRLAVSFVYVNDDNNVDSFTGETGGDWVEAVAEFKTTAGADGAIQLQTANMPSAGTISGGSYTMTASDPWGVRAFALKGTRNPPRYSDNSTNSTLAGTLVEHRLRWNDNEGLSGYIFSFDNCTGSFVNDTWIAISGTSNWSNVTKKINSTSGCTIRWCVYANDTDNFWNGTSCTNPFSYTTSENIPPIITIQSPINTTYFTDSIWANVTLNEAGSWCGRSLDGGVNITLTNSSGNWNNLMTSISDGSHNVRFCCNDTYNNMNCSAVEFFSVYVSVIPPQYFLNSTNSTLAGAAVKHRLYWIDDIGLSGYIFSWYNGANWTFENQSSDLESNTIQYKGQITVTYTNAFFDSFEDGVAWTHWTETQGTSWINSLNGGCGIGSCASGSYCACSEADTGAPDILAQTNAVNLASYSDCKLEWWQWLDTALDSGGDYFKVDVINSSGSWVNIYTCTASGGCDNGAWTLMNYNITSGIGLNNNFKVRFQAESENGEELGVDEVNITCKLVSKDTEANKTYTIYNNVYNYEVLEVIKNITVNVDVSFYSNAGSSGVNSNPDLWLEIYDGSSWIEIGNMSVTGTGNFSKSTQDPKILNAWLNPENRDLRIRGRYFDYKDASNTDEISYTAIWVQIESTQEFLNDTWVAWAGNPTKAWSNITKIINSTMDSTIKWRVYANDTDNNWNSSEIYSYVTTIYVAPVITISLSDTIVWWDESINISIQAMRGGTPIVGGDVEIHQDSNVVCSQSSATDSNGRYSCVFNAAKKLGNHTIQVNVKEPSTGEMITNTSSLIVKIILGSSEIEKRGAPKVSCYNIPRIIVNPDGSLQKTITKVCVWK